MALATGSAAPDFTLKSKNASGLVDVKLSENFGKKNTVLLFFPLAFTSVCTDELCSVSGGIAEYQGLNAEVYAISVDSPFAQEAFAKANNITISILSDFNKTVSAAYDVLYADLLGFKGVSKRSAFVVNKEGKITFAWSSEDPKKLPPFDELKKALA